MSLPIQVPVDVPTSLLDAIRSFPRQRTVEHCGGTFGASPFDFYATCPHCGVRIKLRSFSGGVEIEDVFDAVFEWMNQPGTQDLVRRRREALQAETED